MIKDIIDSISNDNNIAAKTEALEYIEMLVLFKAFILASKIPELHYLQVKNTISQALLELGDIPEKPKRCIGEFSIYTIKCFQKVFYLLMIIEVSRRLKRDYSDYRIQLKEFTLGRGINITFEVFEIILSHLSGPKVDEEMFDFDHQTRCLLNEVYSFDAISDAMKDPQTSFNLNEILINDFGNEWVKNNYADTQTKNEKALQKDLKSWLNIFRVHPHKIALKKFKSKSSFGKDLEKHFKSDTSTLFAHNFFFLSSYIPKRKRELFNDIELQNTNKIIDLKRFESFAINYFSEIIDKILTDNCIIVNVPSSTKDKPIGIENLVRKLCEGNERLDLSYKYLCRRKTIPKKSHGGERNEERDFDSLHINPVYSPPLNKGVEATENVLEGKDILLIDDVATSTISISTAQKKLLDIGANRVICLVLGRTI